MALADATVRVILDVSRFGRDLETKVASAARRAGRTFETEFNKGARDAGTRWSRQFAEGANDRMGSAGTRAGTTFGRSVRVSARGSGRETGRDLGEQIRGGLVSTATLTGRRFGRGLLSGSITEAGNRLGQRLGVAIGANLNVRGLGARLQRDIDEETEPGILAAARTVAQRFGRALSASLGAVSIGRMGFLVAAITGLVSEGLQLAAALAPALQAIGLIPATAAVAGASIATLMVAFKGFGDAMSAAASGDAKELAEALKELSPAAASVVKEFAKFSPRLKELRRQVQQAFFSELTGDLTKLGQTLLGPVQRGMTATAGAAGRMASGLLGVVSTARNAATIEQIFGSAANAFDEMTVPLQRFTQGILNWIRATLPAFDQLIASLGAGATRFGDFLSRAAASGQAMAWVNEAITTISQLGRVVGSAGRLLGTIFDAANAAGGNYLTNLNNALIATRQFLAVGEGRTALISIFQGLREVITALAEPLKAAVVAFGQISRVAGSVAKALSAGVADAIRGIGQAIQNAGPGLTRFSETVGSVLSDIGAVLPGVGASLGKLLSAVSPLVSILGVIARAGAALLNVFASLPSPILTVVAAFVALRALGMGNVLQSIQTRVAGLGTAATSLGDRWRTLSMTFQTNLATLTAQRIAQQAANNAMSSGIPTVSAFGSAMGSLADRARAAGQAVGGPVLRGFQGLIGALGGGIGIALTAATVLLGFWADSQAKAQREVQEHNNRINQLASTLDRTTGSITAATKAQARQTFGQGDLADSARRLGLSIDLVADAATNAGPAQRFLNNELQNSAINVLRTSDRFSIGRQEAERYGLSLETIATAARGNSAAQDQVRAAVDRYAASLGVMERSEFDVAGNTELLIGLAKEMIPDQIALGDAVAKTADDLRKQAEAIQRANAAYSPTQQLAESLAEAMNTLASNSSSAADKARALDTALRILSGGTLELNDAQKNSADAISQGNDQLKQLVDKYAIAGKSAKALGITTQEYAARQKDLGKALFDSSGQIDFTSERARGLYDVAKNLRQATLDQTAAIIDNAQKTGGDMAAAHKRAADAMAAARQQIIDWARQVGYSEEDAQRLANTLNLVPDDVKIALTMQGVPPILAQLGQIQGRIELLPDKKSLRLDSNAAPLRGELERLGFTVEDIPGTKDIKITPNTGDAEVALRTFIEQQITARRPDMIVGADIDLAKADAETLRKFIAGLPAVVTPSVNPGPAKTEIGRLLDSLLTPGQPTITPGINPGPAEKGLGNLLAPPAAGQPQLTPGVNPDPAQRGLEGLLLPLPNGSPQITPGANVAPARAQMQGLIMQINATTTTGPFINGNTGPAVAQLVGLINRINTSTGNVGVGANTGPAYGGVSTLVGWIGRNGASVGVGANAGAAYTAVDNLVRYINRQVATIEVRTTNPEIQAAQGGLFRYFRKGGFNSKRPMPANRAEIVPPRVQRVIGDRAVGDEAFIPLVNSARSRAILRTAAARLGFDVTPSSQRQVQTRTTNVEAGAIVVNAPQSDPRLVAREVVNELVREAVI